MGFLDALNQGISIVLKTLRQLGRPRIWSPLLILYLVYWLIFHAHYEFASPMFYSVIKWWTSLNIMSGSPGRALAFSHFPHHLVLMVDYFGTAKLLLGTLIEGLILGIVAERFAAVFAGLEKSRPQASPAWRWLNLALAWAIINWLSVLLEYALPGLFPSLIDGPRRAFVFFSFMMPVIWIVIVALLFYAIPFIATRHCHLGSALLRSLRLFGSRPITTLGFSVIVLSGPILVAILLRYSETIVERFNPDIMYWLVMMMLVAELFAAFLWQGVAVRFIQEQRA